uniref:Uncharacterized protein n=1 Tax=Arundo donax TaxID=35708 RepID=A0A0A9BWZ3_ARUDO
MQTTDHIQITPWIIKMCIS